MAGLAVPAQAAPKAGVKDSDPLSVLSQPHATLNTPRSLTKDELKGRILLLNFWNYGDVSCLQLLPGIAKIKGAFGNDVTVIGIHTPLSGHEGDYAALRRAVMRYGIDYPVVNDAEAVVRKAFHVKVWPAFALIDPQGKARTYEGIEGFEELKLDVAALARQYHGKLPREYLGLRPESEQEDYRLLNSPGKIAYVPNYRGNAALLVADSGHDRVLIVDTGGKVLEVIGSGKEGSNDGSYADARFDNPQGVLVKDDTVYIADTGNHLLRAVNLTEKKVRTLAGNTTVGNALRKEKVPALSVGMASPWDITFWPDMQHIAIAVAGLNQLWSYDIEAQTVSVLAGSGDKGMQDGEALQAKMAQPSGLSAMDDRLYVVDATSNSLRVLEKGQMKTLIGSGLTQDGFADGLKDKALMQHPLAVLATKDGVLVADSYNHALRRYDVQRAVLERYIGSGVSGHVDGRQEQALFSQPSGLAAGEGMLYVADTNNQAVRAVNLAKNEVVSLNMKEEPRVDNIQLASELPNTMELDVEQERVSLMHSSEVHLELEIREGWRLHEDAPSYLALFDLLDFNRVVASYDRNMLAQGRLTLPPRVGHAYKLQGVFYYCTDKVAQCLVQSVDLPVSFDEGAPNHYTIKIY